MNGPLTCLVTVHGIGFQQFPMDGRRGYADGLHRCLSARLGDALSDDPERSAGRAERGRAGPIYVSSHWPPSSDATEPGLARLGLRYPSDPSRTDVSGARLDDGTGRIVHVALVYSRLEDIGPDVKSFAELTVLSVPSALRYASVGGLARLAVEDVAAFFALRRGAVSECQQVRHDLPRRRLGLPRFRAGHRREPGQNHSGFFAIITQIQDDVAAYVCRNDLRERVRAFVREVLLRLILRDDVGNIVVNAHSSGSVIAFDVLRELPPGLVRKVRAFVTSGSPLRKYTQLFSWGYEAANIHEVRGPWLNFWDPRDPVADPLAPPLDWKRGQPLPRDGPGLYRWTDPDTGRSELVPVRDRQVDNLKHSAPGGLRAHNYWDNDTEFVAPLAVLLLEAAASRG